MTGTIKLFRQICPKTIVITSKLRFTPLPDILQKKVNSMQNKDPNIKTNYVGEAC